MQDVLYIKNLRMLKMDNIVIAAVTAVRNPAEKNRLKSVKNLTRLLTSHIYLCLNEIDTINVGF